MRRSPMHRQQRCNGQIVLIVSHFSCDFRFRSSKDILGCLDLLLQSLKLLAKQAENRCGFVGALEAFSPSFAHGILENFYSLLMHHGAGRVDHVNFHLLRGVQANNLFLLRLASVVHGLKRLHNAPNLVGHHPRHVALNQRNKSHALSGKHPRYPLHVRANQRVLRVHLRVANAFRIQPAKLRIFREPWPSKRTGRPARLQGKSARHAKSAPPRPGSFSKRHRPRKMPNRIPTSFW